jgi:hypothetical protein
MLYWKSHNYKTDVTSKICFCKDDNFICFAKHITCSIWTSLLDIFLSLFTFFQTSYFFSLKNCWNVNCDIWSSYAGDRSDTIQPVKHPNNNVTVFLFICRINRSLCRCDEISFQSDGIKKIKETTNSLCGLKAYSFHCLDLTFIQFSLFR